VTPMSGALAAQTYPPTWSPRGAARPTTGAGTGDVIDLDSARRVRDARRDVWWDCDACRLSAGPFVRAEAALLADVHDRVMRHADATALRVGSTTSAVAGS
jgi:hypothetical protein